jgi:hypothetical protein
MSVEEFLNTSFTKENESNLYIKKSLNDKTPKSKECKTLEFQTDFNIVEKSKETPKPLRIQKKKSKLLIFEEEKPSQEENLVRKIKKEKIIKKRDDPVFKFVQKMELKEDLNRKVRSEHFILPFEDPFLTRLGQLYPKEENLKRNVRTHTKVINLTQDIQKIKDFYK